MENIFNLFQTNKSKKRLTYDAVALYWRSYLLELSVNLFTWNGLPFPQKEIELINIFNGFGGFVKAPTPKNRFSDYIYTRGGMSGVTEYIDEFTTYIFATPLISGMRVIGKDVAICNGNSLRTPFINIIDFFTIMLSHATLSFQAVLINSRATGIFTASDEKTAASVNQWYNSLVDGKLMCVVSKDDFNDLINAQGLRNISTQYPASTSIKDFWECVNNIMKLFYSTISVKSVTEKRERLITDEINATDDMLRFNISDMLECRKVFCDEVNKIFGLSISVDINTNCCVDATESEEEKNVDSKNIAGDAKSDSGN